MTQVEMIIVAKKLGPQFSFLLLEVEATSITNHMIKTQFTFLPVLFSECGGVVATVWKIEF